MFDKLKKRRAFPVDGIEGGFIRLFTQGEKTRFNALEGDPKGAFLFGCCLVNADGTQCCPREENEEESAWLKRVEEGLSDVDDGVLLLIRDTLHNLMKKGEPVAVEDIAKN